MRNADDMGMPPANAFEAASDTSFVDATLKISKPRYKCPKHGDTDAAMFVRIYEPMTEEYAYDFLIERPIKTERIYCCECYIEALDKLGVSIITEVST